MADKFTAKIKGFFKGDDKSKGQVQEKKYGRGEARSRDELISWLEAKDFASLPSPRGEEAFFRDLWGRYEVDLNITEVDAEAEGMNDNARNYQFWIKCRALNLAALFDTYVLTSGSRLPKVEGEYRDLKAKRDQAADVDDYLRGLRQEVTHDLTTAFDKFKDNLRKKYGPEGEHFI